MALVDLLHGVLGGLELVLGLLHRLGVLLLELVVLHARLEHLGRLDLERRLDIRARSLLLLQLLRHQLGLRGGKPIQSAPTCDGQTNAPCVSRRSQRVRGHRARASSPQRAHEASTRPRSGSGDAPARTATRATLACCQLSEQRRAHLEVESTLLVIRVQRVPHTQRILASVLRHSQE